MRDVAAAALGDRAWQRALVASCLLHGAVIAALLLTWHIQPKLATAPPPIAVTLVRTDDAAPARAAPPVEEIQPAKRAQPVEQAREEQETLSPPAIPAEKPAPPRALAAAAHAAAAHAAAATAKPAPLPAPPTPAPLPKPSDAITALLSESLDGRPRGSGAPSRGASRTIALRSSAKLSEDYLLHLQAWIAREERYPPAARAQHQEGEGIVGFTIARDGKVTRVWIDQSTGSALLDQASLATIRDASPVPPLPHDLAGNSVDFYLPVNYTLSTFERLFR